MIPPYPLAWPEGLPRNERHSSSSFRTGLNGALKNVKESLRLFGSDTGKPVSEVVLSSNVGGLDVDAPIQDPGVAAWFMWDGAQRCIAIDRYKKPEENLQAIHHIIEARRTEMRHGGLNIVRQTFKSFTALPGPSRPPRYWEHVLGFKPGQPYTKDDVERAYREKAKTAHPDRGGTAAAFQELTQARVDALASFPA